MLASKQIAFGKVAGGGLPDGVIPVEYLESTGTQWIDTGFSYNCYTDIVEGLVRITGITTWGSIYGCNSGDYTVSARINHNNSTIQMVGSKIGDVPILLDVEDYYMRTAPEIYGGSCINNATGAAILSDRYVYSISLYICATNNNGTSVSKSKIKLFWYKHTKDDTLVLDLIPVRKGNVGYMYDRVSGQLFGNQGTGEFLLGADI